MYKYFLISILTGASWLCFGHDIIDESDCDAFLEQNSSGATLSQKYFYPNFTNNCAMTKHMKQLMAPYLLPMKHHLKKTMDDLFSCPSVIQSEKTLRKAGFTILFSQKRSRIRVIKHSRLPGYLIKLYPNCEKRLLSSGWKRLTIRCIVAKKIKSIIKKHHIHNFLVADKWLYPLPSSRCHDKVQPVVLLVKNMRIYNRSDSKVKWRKNVSKKIVKELFIILSRGYGSPFLQGNIPYTKMGKFAFIDTEYDKRKIAMDHVRKYLSPSKRNYWDHLLSH